MHHQKDSTAPVKKNIGEKVDEIDSSIIDVTNLSEESTNSITEFVKGLHEIKNATEFLARIGTNNSENISIMNKEISRFSIVDTSALKSSDGQPLIQWNKKQYDPYQG